MSAEENKAIVRRVFEEVVNQAQLATADELFTPEFVGYTAGVAGQVRGPEGLKQFVTTFRAAFPDLRLSIADQVAEGDKVVTRYTITGTHHGPLQGIPATEKRVSWTGITIHRLADGKLAEAWVNLDMLGLLQQVGGMPGPDAAGDQPATIR
ncbi:MAG: ester cyclase [Thermomicrobiales bacterium]